VTPATTPIERGARSGLPPSRYGRRARMRGRGRRGSPLLSRMDRLLLAAAVLPAVAWLGFAQGYPLLYSLYLSFQRWSLASSEVPQGFAGLSNYTEALNDPTFLQALRLSALVLASVPIEICIGFALAYFTMGEGRRMRITRTLLIIPMVIAPIAVGTMFRLLLNPQSGLVDIVLHAVGLPAPDWLGGQSTSVAAVIGTDIWEWVPFSMIIFTAALSSIDQDLLAAARVDGASSWKTVRRIIVPLTLPATMLICLFRLIDAFLIIDVIYSLTFGGPGFATDSATLWVFNHGLRYFDISEAAAASWMLLAICLVMAIVVLWLKGRAERAIAGRAR
jgi:multiple sugar transport system permease protein